MKFLCIIDAQNDFIDGVLGSKEAQEAVDRICETLDNHVDSDVCILLTQDTHYSNYLKTAEGKKLPVEHCMIGTSGRDINAKILNKLDNFNLYSKKFYNKESFGSFKLTRGLQEYSKLDTIESITFMGFCTDICVVSNALMVKTALPEVPIYVKADCCAGVTPEKHAAALEVMKSCQIDII